MRVTLPVRLLPRWEAACAPALCAIGPFALVAALMLSPLAAPAAAAISPASAPSSISGRAVVAEAEHFLHYRYTYTGNSPSAGFSCIGLVSYVYQQLGVAMPDDLGDAMASYPHVARPALEPGDIIFFQNTWWPGVSHVAIYIGSGQIIHAENPQRGVTISDIRNDPTEGSYWQQHYLAAERPWSATSGTPMPTPTAMALTTATPIATGPVVTVVVPVLNVRSRPSLTALIVTVVTKGTQLTLLGTAHGWVQVELADGTVAWVIRQGVSTDSANPGSASTATLPAVPTGTPQPDGHAQGGQTTPTPPTSATTTAQPTGSAGGHAGGHPAPAHSPRFVTSRVNGLRVHTAPSLRAPVIDGLRRGQRVAVLGTVPGWVHVRVRSGLSGWVSASLVGAVSPPPSHGQSQQRHRHAGAHHAAQTRTPTAVPTGGIPARMIGSAHLRSGPSLHAHILGWVMTGTAVTVLRRVPDWDNVRTSDGRTGYVWSAFVSG